MPPHHGHRLVITTALQQAQHVTLVISVLPDDRIPAAQRVRWLQQLYPATTVVAMPVTWHVTDAQAWADGVLTALGGQHPAVVFSSEHYGQQLADLWGCAHVMVNRDRTIVPISASDILKHPANYQHFVDPIVWRDVQQHIPHS